MNKTTQRRLAAIVLLLVCGVALAKIGAGVWGGPANSVAPASAPTSVQDSAPRASASSSNSSNDAILRLDVLQELGSRPLPEMPRNPFEFAPTPAQIQAQHQAEERERNQPPPPPPPPPPVPFKAMGYQKDAKGQQVAYLCTASAAGCADDQETYMVREGQEFGQRFKVLKITDTSVEVQDETYHQIVQLPYPE